MAAKPQAIAKPKNKMFGSDDEDEDSFEKPAAKPKPMAKPVAPVKQQSSSSAKKKPNLFGSDDDDDDSDGGIGK